MNDEKSNDTEQTEATNTATDPAATGGSTKAAATETAQTTDTVAEAAAEKQVWRDGLVQEALGSRPELRKLAAKRDYAASVKTGHDLGFEDGARKLTVAQLQDIGALKDRRMARYALHELPGDLRAYLTERSTGYDETGFLVGYVDGVGDFLEDYKSELNRQS